MDKPLLDYTKLVYKHYWKTVTLRRDLELHRRGFRPGRIYPSSGGR
jgi:RNA 3'-terminal phosphate cyclase